MALNLVTDLQEVEVSQGAVGLELEVLLFRTL
jgi:hypothetical protein